jgi:metal-dependent hydrolase (beta-lactamase superfamily II)
VRRFPLAYDFADHDQLVAEHGFSALVTVESGGSRSSVLYDGGMTPKGLANNLDVMEVDPAGLRAIAISHGHVDHHGGLEGLAARTGRRRLPLLLHPEAWRDRKVTFPTGAVFEPIIEPTVAAFADFGVERLVPGHCTGWKGTHRLAQAMPEAFVQPLVGTTLRF